MQSVLKNCIIFLNNKLHMFLHLTGQADSPKTRLPASDTQEEEMVR